jgi:hypothetical protein
VAAKEYAPSVPLPEQSNGLAQSLLVAFGIPGVWRAVRPPAAKREITAQYG